MLLYLDIVKKCLLPTNLTDELFFRLSWAHILVVRTAFVAFGTKAWILPLFGQKSLFSGLDYGRFCFLLSFMIYCFCGKFVFYS